jgi:hypothetical protein
MKPGPGDYNAEPVKKKGHNMSNVFKSKQRRFSNEINENPPAGDYDIKDSISYAAQLQKNNTSRFFKKEVGPSVKKPTNTLLDEIKNFKIENHQGSKSAEPGPRGLSDAAEKNISNKKAKESYVFVSKASANRNAPLFFGEKTPGPGS